MSTSPLPRLLKLPEVIQLTGLGRDTIYRLAREGTFPKPRKVTERASRWNEHELREWIESRPEARSNAAAVAVAAAAERIRASGDAGTAAEALAKAARVARLPALTARKTRRRRS